MQHTLPVHDPTFLFQFLLKQSHTHTHPLIPMHKEKLTECNPVLCLIPGCPEFPGMITTIPGLPGMKKHLREWIHYPRLPFWTLVTEFLKISLWFSCNDVKYFATIHLLEACWLHSIVSHFISSDIKIQHTTR